MAKTRVSNWAQLMWARDEAAGGSPASVVGTVAWSGLPGTIWARRAANEMEPWTRDEGRQTLEEF